MPQGYLLLYHRQNLSDFPRRQWTLTSISSPREFSREIQVSNREKPEDECTEPSRKEISSGKFQKTAFKWKTLQVTFL